MNNSELPEIQKTGPRFFYGYAVVLVALLIMLISYGTRTSFGVFFKPLLGDFDWNRASISGAVTLSLISQGLWGMVMGRLNDRVGPRVVITLCCVLSGLGFLLLAQMHHLWEIYIYYGVIIGFGMGGVFVALLSTVSRWFVKRRGVMTGIVLAGLGASMLILSPLATWLISVFDWRLAYVAMGGMILVVGTGLAQFLRRDPNSIGSLPYGQHEIEKGIPASNAGGLSLYEAVRTWQFWSVLFIYMCIGFLTFTVVTHFIPHMTDLGITAATAANVMSLSGGAMIIGGILLGMIADRIGPRRVLAICLMLMTVPFFLLISFGDLWILYIISFVFGVGSGASGVAQNSAVAELFGMNSHGLIFGAVSFGFTIGGAVGPFITGHIFDASGSYNLAFIVCIAIGIVGCTLAWLLKPVISHK